MFAYCTNNPINFSDTTGYLPIRNVMLQSNDGGSSYPIDSCVAKTPEEQITGMVNGQGNLPYSNTSIGLGTYGKSGCAYIAIYNALQLIRKPKSLSSITKEVYWNHGTLFFGAGGVPPWSIESYFTANGIQTTGAYSIEPVTAGISEGDVIVFTVFNDKSNIFKGWHAMTALYTKGNYLVFNQYNNSTTYSTYSSLNDAFSNGVWIYGMRIG